MKKSIKGLRTFLYSLGTIAYIGMFLTIFTFLWEITNMDFVQILGTDSLISTWVGLMIFLKIEGIVQGGKND